MTELKTLKDFDNYDTYGDLQKKTEEPFILKDDLKAEAVKWIKDCPHCKFVKYRQQDNNEDVKELSARDFCLSCLKFMRFFNITEEDLKQQTKN